MCIHMYWHSRQSICYLGVVAFHKFKARLLVASRLVCANLLVCLRDSKPRLPLISISVFEMTKYVNYFN